MARRSVGRAPSREPVPTRHHASARMVNGDALASGRETGPIVRRAHRPLMAVAHRDATTRQRVARLLGAVLEVRMFESLVPLRACLRRRQTNLVLIDSALLAADDPDSTLAVLRREAGATGIPFVLMAPREGADPAVDADDVLLEPFADRELQARVGVHLAASRRREAGLNGERAAHIEAERLVEAVCDLASQLDLDVLLKKIADSATRLTRAAFGALLLLADDPAAARPDVQIVGSGQPANLFETLPATRLAGLLSHGNGVVRLEDVSAAGNGRATAEAASAAPLRSFLAVPVISRSGQLTARLLLGHPDAGAFGAQAERLAVAIAAHAAVAIDNARLHDLAQTELLARRRLSAGLREIELRWRLALQAGRVGTWEWFLTTGEMRWSQGLEAMHGLKPGEFKGTFDDVLTIIHPADREAFAEAARRVLEAQADYHVEYRVPAPPQGEWWLETRGMLLFDADGRPERMIGTCIDITERKQAEQAVRDSELRYRQLFEALPAAMYTTDADGRITLFNEAAVNLWGRAPQQGEDEASAVRRVFTADGRPLPSEESPLAVTLREGRAVRGVELIVERPDGTRRHVLPYPEPVRNTAGTLLGAINVLADITELRAAESALAEAKGDLALEVTRLTRLHELAMKLAGTVELEQALQAVLHTIVELHAADFGLVLLYEAGADRLRDCASVGFDEATRTDLARVLPGPDVGACWTAFTTKRRAVVKDIQRDRRFDRYLEIAQAVGFRMVHSTPIVTRSGECLGVLTVYFREPRDPTQRECQMADICARHAADSIEAANSRRALSESEHRFRQMADQAPVLIWINGLEGCEFVNREYLRFVGGTPRDVEKMKWKKYLHPDDAATYLGAYRRAFKARARFEAQCRLRRANGEYRWLRSAGVPRFGADGAFAGYIGCSTDITDIKRSEAALKQAKEMAEAANLSKDQFLAVLSHELRTPLTPVLLAASALEKSEVVPPSVRSDAAMIRDNIRLETRLIDDLLDLSRITSGKLRLQPEIVDLNDAVLHVCGMCRSALDEKAIRLHCDFDESVGPIQADPARLQQILLNLLSNAAKFTPKGGDIYVTTSSQFGRHRVVVRDNGIGIAAETLPRIFDAFEQGDGHITREFGGLGLGLAISNVLVRLHGGTIRAESDGPGSGATFTVELPARPLAAPAPPTDRTEHDAAPPPACRLLIVEDHVATARLLERTLANAGYGIRTAGTVAAARRLLETEPFDLLISDLGLPDGSGCELLEGLTTPRPVKAIAISGYGMMEDVQRSMKAGFSEHLIKPVDIAQLQRTIRKFLGPESPA